MYKSFLLLGAALGALSVMIGAFGAHALRATLEASGRLDTFETAVKYQFYHTLAILLVGVLLLHTQSRLLEWSGWAFLAGIVIFSGSLYVLCLTGIRWMGAITPLGGVALIAGWVLLLIGVSQSSLGGLRQSSALPMPAAVPTTVRLTPGQDLRQELLRLTEQNGWEAACIVSCAGSVSTTALRLANQPDATVYEGHAEIIALSGTLSVNGSHLHLAVSDSTGKTLGGHLMDGSRIYTTAEIVIAPLPHQRFTREPDPTSGYYELVVKAVAHQP